MKNCSTFYRPIRGLSSERQRALCVEIARTLELHIASEYDAENDPDAREEWLKQLTRRRDVAVVAKLECIAETRQTTKRPTADYTSALLAAIQASDYLVDASTGITSRDGKSWRDLVENAGAIIASGRVMSPRRAKQLAARRWAKAEAGIVEVWGQPHMATERERWGQHWRDPTHRNDEAAFNAFPEEYQQQFGSTSTARRIFGPRRPGDNSAGGRPRKQP